MWIFILDSPPACRYSKGVYFYFDVDLSILIAGFFSTPNSIKTRCSSMISEAKLGPQLKIYRGSQIRRNEIIIFLFSFLLLSLIPFYIGIYRTARGYAQYGLVVARTWGISWFYFSFFFLILIIIYGFYRLYQTKFMVSIHPLGIIITRLCRKDLILNWDQISCLYVNHEKSISNRHKLRTYCIIHTKDNQKILLRTSILKNLPELITRIKSAVYVHLYPSMRDNYKNGKILLFGPIELQYKYIKVKRLFLGSAAPEIFWKDIDIITIKSGYLEIRTRTRRVYKLRSAKIPNIELLLELIKDNARV